MDNRPIGIFDSGVGGLSAVKALGRIAPWEDFVYFGDTARVPYGDRTAREILRLSRQDAHFMRTKNVKALLIACNTATVAALAALRRENPALPVIGVVEPTAAEAVAATRTGRIGLLATNATVTSGKYEQAIHTLMPDAQVTAIGSSLLVPMIETGHTAPDDNVLLDVLRDYLKPFRASAADTVILGCTHYPLIRDAVQLLVGPEVTLIDSGSASIGALLAALERRGALGDKARTGRGQYYCSARRGMFVAVARAFLGRDIDALTEEIDIEQY